ncbi:MAG: thioredoxin-dependent thiol peroxidase [Flavobacteriales bacterium]|jgi:peroxiredoxin Q/BCP|nr:thioredoxin-dependent thiol peroxidase [Flavobacteriales bacterium]
MLKVGDKAPNFISVDENGEPIQLADYSDKKLILYFYPKDSTPGCTLEAQNLRDNYELLKSKGYEVVGVSADSQKRHQNFIAKQCLPFKLIADEEKAVINAYECWGPKKFMGREFEGIYRKTFVIENGIIIKLIEKVKTKVHTEQILEA